METKYRSEAERLAARPYIIETKPSETTDGDPSWVAFVMELDGCIGQGQTREEAITDVKLAMVDFIETLLEFGELVPEPQHARTATAGVSTKLIVKNVSNPAERTTNRVVQFALSNVS